jgi:two-component system nitrogen regulation sensor histidine kinase NtrY
MNEALTVRLRQGWLARNMGMILAVLALTCATLTFALITRAGGTGNVKPSTILTALVIDIVFLATLAGIIGARIWALWAALRRGLAGSRMQKRIIVLFSTVTIVPAAIVSIFSALFFNVGIQAWFNERVSTAVTESLAVAEAYLSEHKENIRADILAMANDLNREIDLTRSNPAMFNQIVSAQSVARSLAEAVVIQHNRVIAQGPLSFALALEQIPPEAAVRAARGEVAFLASDPDKVRAMVRLGGDSDSYLIVGRLVDSRVIDHMKKTQGAVNEYGRLRQQLANLQLIFSVVFVALVLLLLLAAVWYGMYFASKLVAPVSRLAAAAERVRGGDFSVKVTTGPGNDEIGTLERAFNRMTEQLSAQRSELMQANRALDERRRFIEAVLAGVSAGIVALDADKSISLTNRTAANILRQGKNASLQGKAIHEALPGIAELLTAAESNPGDEQQTTLTITREGRQITLHVRVAVEKAGDHVEGYIVTFDDITLLVSAQRNAAWADVARRVAHEIKNPLTPIQLAAERLKKKYLSMVGDDAEAFAKYTDTISRHVSDIGKMVDEFVSFARMPTPVFRGEDLGAMIKKSIFSQQCAYPEISYVTHLPSTPLMLLCDERQISQALLNLLKNASESIESRLKNAPAGTAAPGKIVITLDTRGDAPFIEIRDNGTGFPPDQIARMLDPYVSTRGRGSGLGLAIVKKIMEDHKASLQLVNHPEGGACVTLSFSAESAINTTLVSSEIA